MQAIRYRLIIPEDLNMQQIKYAVDKGARFIVYSYNIGLIAAMIEGLSPAIWVPADARERTYKKRYNWLSALFGWWHIYGFPKTIFNIRNNNRGGMDVTEDILLNLQEEDLHHKVVHIMYSNMVYTTPNKVDIKAFQKAFALLPPTIDIAQCVLAVDLYQSNTFVIGLRMHHQPVSFCIDTIEKALRRKFLPHVRFEYIDLSIDHFDNPVLIQQGYAFI